MIREIVWYGDNILKEMSSPVDKVDGEIITLIDDMFETMYNANGVGLSAVQIGVLKSVITVGFDEDDGDSVKIALINPEIIEYSDEEECGEEGCLSVPDIRDDVFRSITIKVKYLDIEGNEKILEASDFFARVLQHEIDHINGIMFIDRLEPHQKKIHKKELKDIRIQNQNRVNKKSLKEWKIFYLI